MGIYRDKLGEKIWMQKFETILTNLIYYKIVVLIVFLSSTVYRLSFVYNYGVYVIVVLGCLLLAYNTFKKNIKYQKIDIVLVLFIVSYCVTVSMNHEIGVPKQLFVLMCCLMYFLCFFCADMLSYSQMKREMDIIMIIIIGFTFITLLLSFSSLFYDVISGRHGSYNLHAGNRFQFIGIYSGIATLAVMSGFSAIGSLYFLLCKNHFLKGNKWFDIFNIINFLLQDFALTLSYTSAGIVTFSGALFIGVLGFSMYKWEKKFVLKYIITIMVSILIIISNYAIMNHLGACFVSAIFDDTNSESQTTIAADESISGLTNSNGRRDIWIEALDQWSKHPFFGIGYGAFDCDFTVVDGDEVICLEYTNTHSGYIELLVVCGAFGFICIICFGGYYLLQFFRFFFNSKLYYEQLGTAMTSIYICLYALINELFILDRCLNTFLLCSFLGVTRIMLQNHREMDKDPNEEISSN